MYVFAEMDHVFLFTNVHMHLLVLSFFVIKLLFVLLGIKIHIHKDKKKCRAIIKPLSFGLISYTSFLTQETHPLIRPALLLTLYIIAPLYICKGVPIDQCLLPLTLALP